MVLNHQTHMTNLLTRSGLAIADRHARQTQNRRRCRHHVRETARELVDYMLFVDEAPLPSPIRGASTFAQDFPSKGPRDGKGRSLRDLDLTRRLLRYPCSYMIYSEAFEVLPPAARTLVYERLWEVLSGAATDWNYSTLSA